MNKEKIKKYIVDIIALFKKQAMEAKREAEYPKKGFEDYSKGEVTAYCKMISCMKDLAFQFDIDQKQINLYDIEPERDLI